MEEVWKGTEHIGEFCIMSDVNEKLDEFYLIWIQTKKNRPRRRKK